MTYRIPLLVTIAALLIVSPASAQQIETPVDLRPVWQDGQTAKYKTITRRVTAAQVRGVGKPRTSVMDVTAIVNWQVVDANPDGGGKCIMTVEDLKVEVTPASGEKKTITKDRAEEDLKSVQQLIRGMIGKPVTVQVAKDGRVTSASGWQAIRNASGDAGKSLTETDFIESATELAPLTGGKQGADMAGKWSEKFTWDHEMGELHLNSDFKVTGIESVAGIGLVTIEGESKTTFTPDNAKLNKGGPQVNLKLAKGAAKQSIMYDLSRHEVVGRDMTRSLIFQMDIEYEGRKFQQIIQQQMRTQVLRMEEGE
jgi:hypothetical protein